MKSLVSLLKKEVTRGKEIEETSVSNNPFNYDIINYIEHLNPESLLMHFLVS